MQEHRIWESRYLLRLRDVCLASFELCEKSKFGLVSAKVYTNMCSSSHNAMRLEIPLTILMVAVHHCTGRFGRNLLPHTAKLRIDYRFRCFRVGLRKVAYSFLKGQHRSKSLDYAVVNGWRRPHSVKWVKRVCFLVKKEKPYQDSECKVAQFLVHCCIKISSWFCEK